MKLLLAVIVSLLALPATAEACEGGRTTVSGETVAEVARRCGVNPEALRQLNPGLSDRTIRPGLIIAVPPRPLPSPQAGYGRPQVTAQPPLASGANIHIHVPRHQPAPPAAGFQRPLVGHMPSILEPPF